MKQLLIISNEQFGYHTDSFKYCEYLKEVYDITYFCFYKGSKKILMDNVKVVYIPWKGSKLKRSFSFIIRALFQMIKCKGITFIIYFNGFSLLHFLLPWKKSILDIRPLSVSPNELRRKWENCFLRFSAKTFSFVTVISTGVQKELSLSVKKTYLLPLGADVISEKIKSYDALRLLYVGTLSGRNILDTVKGFYSFSQEMPKDFSMIYHIVGDGNERKDIEEFVRINQLENIVKIHGYLHHIDLVSLFDECNVGVSYVPLTNYYDKQPVTKTFEYIFSGLYTIATNTTSNREVINPSCGILIKDTSVSFSEALKEVVSVFPLDSSQISANLSQYKWANIVNTYLQTVLKKVEK